ncbi:MAG: pyridoxamine 5'-phosphate oxidase [Alphaproteobacteria bacterium]
MSGETATVEAVTQDSLIEGDDPFALFERWLKDAEASEPADANAMTLATVDDDGLPDARIVLLKGLRDGQFVFYTNTLSAKGCQLAARPGAALCFHWKSLARQVRLRGPVEPVSAEEADAYFATRPRGSQIGAWASSQSSPLDERRTLIDAVAKTEADYADRSIPRPPHWSGYALTPVRVEFWQDQPFRLHDRLVFERTNADSAWSRGRVFP